MIHGSRLKTVKAFQLFEASDVMEQGNNLCQLGIFGGQSHAVADFFHIVHHPVGMYDLQADLIIVAVIAIQIVFKFVFCVCIVHRKSSLFTFFYSIRKYRLTDKVRHNCVHHVL